MRFAEHKALLSVAEQDALHQRLEILSQRSGLTREFVLNLDRESRLDGAAWQEIAQAILRAQPDFVNLTAAIVPTLQRLTLQGEPIRQPWPFLYGRVVTKDRFVQQIIKLGGGTSPRQVERFLTHLMKKPLVVIQKRLENQLLAPYAMWATFCAANPADNPFTTLPQDAEGIRACLGLDPNEQGDLFQFVYSLPVGVEPRFPTVADAYAGGIATWLFRPALEHESHGWTLSWPWRKDVSPCPEVIHACITGATLAAPIEIVR